MANSNDGRQGVCPIARWSFDEAEPTHVEDAVSGERTVVNHVFADARFQPDLPPRYATGVRGTALDFDGYSTFIETTPDGIESITDRLSIEAWIAPRSHRASDTGRLSAVVSCVEGDQQRGFEFGLSKHGAWSFQVGLGEAWLAITDETNRLPKDEWSHITGVYDGRGAESVLSLYLNGENVASETFDDTGGIALPQSTVVIGRSTTPTTIADCFPLESFDGLLDEVSLYDTALGEDDIRAHVNEARAANGGSIPEISREEFALDSSRYADDVHRPTYHPVPPGHWMNEPHAPIYYNGHYHLFYQHNPRGPYWGDIHWGHWVSDDLVHWRHLPIALEPEAGDLDRDGIWSGNAAYDADGEPVLFYTAGNMANTPDQRISTATPVDPADPDLVDWEKSGEIVMERPEGVGLRPNDFRDPFLWQEDGMWYCLVGAGIEGAGGTVLVFQSPNLDDWQFEGEFFQTNHDQYPELGTVWELPILLPLGEDAAGDEKHVFIISPVGPGADIEVYYWLGTWNRSSHEFVPDHDAPRRIDYGDFAFTGPSAMRDPKTGRCILFTIAQDQRRPRDQYDAGWAHNGGLPVELYLRDDDRLGIEPIKEVRTLRRDPLVELRDVSLEAANRQIGEVRSDTVEVDLEITTTRASKYGIEFRKSPDGEERTLLYYDETREEIVLHREESTEDLDVRTGLTDRSRLVHTGPLAVEDGTLDLRLFLDRSMVECYLDSRKAVTSRVYPERSDATRLGLWADGDVSIESLTVWELESIDL